jgi:hypothetical protein
LLNNYTFTREGEDKNNEGLMIPRYLATGRTAPNGKVYPEVARTNEDDLVPVRSIVKKKTGDINLVTPDLLSKRFLQASFPNNSALGLSAGTSFSESTTQSLLGLKHGGHERIQDLTGNLYAEKDCTVREEGKWLILKVRGGEQKFPRPSNWVAMPKEKYSAGELIGTAYNSTSPVYKLNAVIKLMNAKGSSGIKYYEKDKVIIADCYSYNEGKIKYVEDKEGRIEVYIGDTRYAYSPESMYYYPEGTVIKKYQRFCSGVANMRQVSSDLGSDIDGIFNIFRKQYYSLTSSSYQKSGVVSPGDMQEEIIELVFTGLTNPKYVDGNPENKLEELEYLGTQNAILNRKSFFTTLSYGWSNKIIGKALSGEIELENDVMTDTILGVLMNDKLDKI